MHATRVCAALSVALLTACTEASGPSAAPRSALLATRVATIPVANATVSVLAGLDGATPTAINDSDLVVGQKGTDAFRWQTTTGVQLLPVPPGSEAATATAVNVLGNIAGNIGSHPALWPRSGGVRVTAFTDTLQRITSCTANGINVYSVIVGYCVFNEAFSAPALFGWHGEIQTVGGDNVILTAISDDGYMSATSLLGPPGAWLWRKTGLFYTLRSHDSTSQYRAALAVTRHGWAAGMDFEDGCSQAVAWLSASQIQYPEFRLGTCGTAAGLTDDWYVVGTGTNAAGDSAYAFVWFPGTGLQRLPGLGGAGEQSAAVAINARHHVLGTITSGGVTHTVLWKVAPR